ncbi:RsmB/NOP family class I SAM-dependent RNA methyltransferase [Ruegeria aquimaris]|uniref:RsmB/NOP family class I SAM-dependent RNA methyltransferase n=1 Tax=Ruegeria aquimaris TaxID=2984333 RepID=A0ABT3AN34_9RHOB|nr:RsmB/NOP family class I SAM-dependent RNA methyltransferase [Ruegeria sp. XHP0148]MCV2890097.1 RsmB/NOP family class I SAM-dependent RNA methyltransferase [Ruegeria sp. XHP0148]
MTPGARVQAAIEILDEILEGKPAEQALTTWARRSRFAGSKDRAAIRDHVFDALRGRRSLAALGGAATGRGLMIGLVRAQGGDVDGLFSGAGHAPEPVTEAERAKARDPAPGAEAADIPDWLWPRFQAALGARAEEAGRIMQTRAPLHLRANLLRTDRAGASAALAADGITAVAHPACDTALEVTEGARQVARSQAYLEGLVELQDAASQAIVARLPLQPGARVLDYCAGGGGKTLALAARMQSEVLAHDAAQQRMRDLPERAARAGAKVRLLATEGLDREAPFDLVLTDVPCSGSGSWRRAPDGKWALTPERLAELGRIQRAILQRAAELVAADGVLAYATCSMLHEENGDVVADFLAEQTDWCLSEEAHWTVLDGTDGFFLAVLTRVGVK